MVLERIANPSLDESRVLSSSLSRTARCCPCGQIGKVASLKRKNSLGSTPSGGTSFNIRPNAGNRGSSGLVAGACRSESVNTT